MSRQVINSHYARATYYIRPLDISKVLCHRRKNGIEQYLIRWKSAPEYPVPPRAICSWHALDELELCLHQVQAYIEDRGSARTNSHTTNGSLACVVSRKRKSPNEDPGQSRDGPGLFTSRNSSHPSRSPSVISINSSSDGVDDREDAVVYNGVLQRKEGRVIAKRSRDVGVVTLNATKLPTVQMRKVAASTPVAIAKRLIRAVFMEKLRSVPNVTLENTIDDATPSLDFTFVRDFVLGVGVYRADSGANEGCQKPCKPNMGQHIGCEYTRSCSCLEFAAVNEQELQKRDPDLYAQYLRAKERNEIIDTLGLPKRFPYRRPHVDERIPSTLQCFYREERHPIYECNQNCNCGPVCKSRLVQKGRKVPLVIFKTHDRGWGVKCGEDLIQGEFIDTYLGEVITNEEADRREARAGKDKASYLYNLDKFVGDDETLTEDTCYVVDGQHVGGPTRFINHSCEPNCRQYTVSYNKHDLRIYELAFFAYEDIPAGTELTFDYMDKDDEEEEEVLRKREEAANDPDNHDKKPCNCGARKCRGYLWV